MSQLIPMYRHISACLAQWYRYRMGFCIIALLLVALAMPAAADGVIPGADLLVEPIAPLPLSVELDRAKVALGEKLFHEMQFAQNQQMSCASCHPLHRGGMDHKIHVLTLRGKALAFNTPSIFNSAYSFKTGWLGNTDNLDQHMDSLIYARTAFATSWPQIIERLRQKPAYVADFAALYQDTIKAEHINDALSVFNHSLFTPNSRFDRYLRGERSALTADEKAGYHEFKAHGCIACHQGINIGGNLFQKFGVFGSYFTEPSSATDLNLGRFIITGRARDRHVFRVPSLRNVVLTAPYFHDGSTATLEEAVKIMARYQLGQTPAPRDIELMVKFLGTLTGEYRGQAQ